MKELRIIGIHVFDRIKEAGNTQKILSDFSDCINTRLGFHEVSEEKCSRNGMIVLELSGASERCDALQKALDDIRGIEVKHMAFKL